MDIRSKLLAIPAVYDRFQNGLARDWARDWLSDKMIQASSGMRVLDIGCGTAAVLRTLPMVEYLGIDHNPDYLTKARREFGQRGNFQLVDINDLDIPSLGRFERILMIGVLHHLSDEESTRLLDAVAHALAPDGKLITLDPGLVKGQHPVARILAKLDRGRFVRSPAQYRQLIETALKVDDELTKHDLIRLPYTHVAFRAQLR